MTTPLSPSATAARADAPPGGFDPARRAERALLARATREELAPTEALVPAGVAVITRRAPEIGLVLLRGRAGGTGAPFNLGEATATRAALRLSSGEGGEACVLGRDRPRARLVALADALLRHPEAGDAVRRRVLGPVRERLAREAAARARDVAATTVSFFTLVRGEDAPA